MTAKTRSFFSVCLSVCVFCIVMISSVLSQGQNASNQPASNPAGGLPDDWTHHRLVFSNPGSASEALAQGRTEEWSRITGSARYRMQQLKRDQAQRLAAAAPDFASRMNILNTMSAAAMANARKPVRTQSEPINKDWNMNLGPSSAASLTAAVGTMVDPLTITSGQTFTLDGVTFTATAPVAAKVAGTFSGAPPSTSQALVINNPSIPSSITLTASDGVAGTQTGSFGAVPTEATAHAADNITIANGANTLTVTTNATGATLAGTWTNDPTSGETAPTVTISGVTTTLAIASDAVLPAATATFSAAPAGNVTIAYGLAQTLTLTAAAGTNTSAYVQVTTGNVTNTYSLGVGGVTYSFAASCTSASSPCIVIGTNNHLTADNIEAAINNNSTECGSTAPCFGDISAPNPEAAAGAPTLSGTSYRTPITNEYYTSVSLSATGTNLTVSTASITQSTANGCTSAIAGAFIIGTGANGSATNLYNVLNGTACKTTYLVPVTVSGLNNNTFNVAETIYGTTSTAFGGTATGFAWSSQVGGVGSANSCTMVSGTAYTANYEASTSTTTLATSVAAALAACPAAGGNIYAVHGAGAAFTVYNNTLGTATSTISAEAAGTPSLVTWGTLAAGSTGSNTCGSTNTATFQVLAADTTTTNIATELAAALNACATTNDATIGIATGASSPHTTSSGAQITITANKWVANPGLTLGYTSGGPFSWSASSITNGVPGNGTAPNFAIDNITTDDAANLAAAIVSLGSTVGVTATAATGVVTITASTAGTGGNSLTFTSNLTGVSLAASGNLTGGSDGTTSATNFKYWTVSAYDTQSQFASDIVAALTANTGTITPAFTIGAANNPAVGDIVLTYKNAGAGGNTQALTPNFTALTGGSFTGGASTQTAALYPAKYSFSTTAAGLCSNSATPDYVAYASSLPGSGSQANIIAYDNIYTGCPSAGGAATVPLVYWSYNTGPGTVLTSPVLSLDGTKVAFVETGTPSGSATLRILQFHGGEGSDYNSPAPIDNNYINTTALAGGNTPWSTCPAGSSCLISIAFQADGHTDSNSSPWYDYDSDTLWVGDDDGYLHEFTGVFNGTPGEVTTNWPVAVRSGFVLTGPVYDNAKGLVFVGSSDGYLESVNASTRAVIVSGQLGYTSGVGIHDSPLVDVSAARVYTFVNADSAGGARVNQLVDPLTAGSTGTYNYETSTSALPVFAGVFDNTYYNSANAASPTGHLWFCAQPDTLFVVTITANAITNGAATTGPKLSNDTSSPCSPVTEFYNGTSDYIFASPQTQTATPLESCTASTGCVISFTVSGTTATFKGSGAFAGGASGIVVDTQNTTVSGALQIYFGALGGSGCTGNSGTGGTEGSGTGGCAIQASQTAP